jgi:hypothetical protein
MKFGKFSCGCIGFENKLIIRPCDGDRLAVSTREINLPFEPFSEADLEVFADGLGDLIADGYRFREIKRLLEGGGIYS